jgi:hypothetical protein
MMTISGGEYTVQLPDDPLKAALWSALLPRLFELAGEEMGVLLEESLYRTTTELQEEAYQDRCRRLEDLGFQDYFEAVRIYTPLRLGTDLPIKNREEAAADSTLPETRGNRSAGPLLFQALAGIDDEAVLRPLLEEITFLCNMLMAADRVRPDDTEQLKEVIRKALAGLNLGLSLASRDEPGPAETILRRYFLVSLFQLGYGQLVELHLEAVRLAARGLREDLFEQATLEALSERFPKLPELEAGKVVTRYFWNRADLAEAAGRLDRIEDGG